MGFSRQEYWSGVPLPSPPIPPYYNTKVLFIAVGFTLYIMSAIKKKIYKAYWKTKTTEQASKPDTAMMLELSDQEFKNNYD